MCLHWQNHTSLLSAAVKTSGANPVPLWEPSQNGCPFDSPQRHQAYVRPSSTFTATGCFAAIFGSGIASSFSTGPHGSPAGAGFKEVARYLLNPAAGAMMTGLNGARAAFTSSLGAP